jgi:hypothetical protein
MILLKRFGAPACLVPACVAGLVLEAWWMAYGTGTSGTLTCESGTFGFTCR